MPIPRPDLTSAHELAALDVQASRVVPDVGERVVGILRERARIGYERYGTTLTAHNGRSGPRDAIEEAADLVVYLRTGVDEGWCPDWLYRNTLPILVQLVADHGTWLQP